MTEESQEPEEYFFKELTDKHRKEMEEAIELRKKELQEVAKSLKGKDGKDANEERIIVRATLETLKRIPKPQDGKPGKDADEEKIVKKVLSKIPKQEKLDTKELERKILSRVPKIDLTPISEKIDKIPFNKLEKKIKVLETKNDNLYKQLSFYSSNYSSYGGEVDKLSLLTSDVKINNPTNGQILKYNSTDGKWENGTGGGGGATVFTDLTDVPSSYSGTGKLLRINGTNDGLEFFTSTYLTSVTAHNILSATHGDTLTDSVVAGDVIIGNATPKWSRLAKGTDGYVLTIDSSTHLPSWKVSTGGLTDITTTTTLYVNSTIGNDSTGTGTIAKPYATISKAVTAGNALANAYSIQVSPGSYSDTNATVVTPTQQIYIHGNGASYTIYTTGTTLGGTWTLSQGFTIYDLNILGNVSQTNTALSIINNLFNSYIFGNLTVLGYLNTFEDEVTGNSVSNSTITIGSVSNSTAFLIAQNCSFGLQYTGANPNYQTKVVNWGTYWNLDTDVFANDAGYAVDSSATGSNFTGSTLLLVNAYLNGGGLNVNNGATTNPNEIINAEVFVNGTTNAINYGTANTYLDAYKCFNSNTGLPIIANGTLSNLQSSYYGPITILGDQTFNTGANRHISIEDQPTTNASGSNLYIASQKGNGSGNGGILTVSSGAGGATGNGGQSVLYGGAGGATSGNGGNADVVGGSATTSGNGGNVILQAGAKAGAGTDGSILLSQPGGTGVNAIFGLGSLASTDKTFTFPNVTGQFTLDANTTTLTNKRVTKRVYNTTTLSTLTPEISTYDEFELTAQGGALTIANHSTSTPAAGDKMIITVLATGADRTPTFDTKYRAMGNALPTLFTNGKKTVMGFRWDNTASYWDLIALSVQA